MVKRYKPTIRVNRTGYPSQFAVMVESSTGEYVAYYDYEAMREENVRLREALERFGVVSK